MTLEEIRNSDKLFLTPSDISEVIGSDPDTIRTTAQSRPELLGFNVSVVGNRTKIWRKPFIKFITGE